MRRCDARVAKALLQSIVGFALLDAAPFKSASVPDPELAVMRGGFVLSNGLDISVGIDLQTSVNGALVLHTQYSTDGPQSGIQVSTGASAASGGNGVVVSVAGQGGMPIVQGANQVGQLSVTAVPASAKTDLVIRSAPAPVGNQTDGGLSLVENGPAIQTPSGSYALSGTDRNSVASFNGPDLQIQQLIGQSTGVLIANSANNRTIDTVSTISIDLHNLPVTQLSDFFVASRAALTAAQSR